MADVKIKVESSGPIFDGRARQAAKDLLRDVVNTDADQGLANWRANLDGSLRHPTGRYMSKTMVSRHGDSAVVNDGNAVYGPWLEGTGSRNRSTRFKGYFAIRRASQRLATQTQAIGERLLRKYLAVMRG